MYSASNVVSITRRASGDAMTKLVADNVRLRAAGFRRAEVLQHVRESALISQHRMDEIRKVPHGAVVERERHQRLHRNRRADPDWCASMASTSAASETMRAPDVVIVCRSTGSATWSLCA